MLIKCVKCDYSVRFGRTDGRLVLVSRFPCVLAERVRDSIYSMALRRMNPERETYLTGPVFLRTQYSIFFLKTRVAVAVQQEFQMDLYSIFLFMFTLLSRCALSSTA